MSLISIEGIECYAFHGCLEEEAVIGGYYLTDVYIHADVNRAFISDKLDDTVDYVMVHEVVRREMAVRSNLIEHVASRILNAIEREIKSHKKIQVRVTKINPPVNGQAGCASVLVETD